MTDRDPGSIRVTPLVLHVLLSLAGGDAHAYGIMKSIEARTDGRVKAGPGSVHFTLTRLVDAGLIAEADAPLVDAADDARRKYFRISKDGRAVLEAELAVWADVVELARESDLIPGAGS